MSEGSIKYLITFCWYLHFSLFQENKDKVAFQYIICYSFGFYWIFKGFKGSFTQHGCNSDDDTKLANSDLL